MTKRQIFISNALALYRASKQFDRDRPSMEGMVSFCFWGIGRDRLEFRSGHEARVFLNKMVRNFKG